jgi:hypothetical protein
MLSTKKPKDLTPQDAPAALAQGSLALVDIRNADEPATWEKAGLASERAGGGA